MVTSLKLGETLKERACFRQDVMQAWENYQITGLHLTGEEANAWLATLEAGVDANVPTCHT